MFTRFPRNVRLYPRTFAVLLVLAVIDVVVEIGFRHMPLVGDAVIAALAVAIYFWFMRSALRMNALLRLLDTFEGRVSFVPVLDYVSAEERYNEADEDCGDPDCSACHGASNLIDDEQGQDVAEYAVMLAVILAIVIGVMRLIGTNAGNVFSQIGSKIQ